ncbi:hypothetical protein [Streptomyces thermolineatus]
MYEIETSEGDDGTMHPPNSFDLPPIVVSDLFGIPPQHRLRLGSVRPKQLG